MLARRIATEMKNRRVHFNWINKPADRKLVDERWAALPVQDQADYNMHADVESATQKASCSTQARSRVVAVVVDSPAHATSAAPSETQLAMVIRPAERMLS